MPRCNSHFLFWFVGEAGWCCLLRAQLSHSEGPNVSARPRTAARIAFPNARPCSGKHALGNAAAASVCGRGGVLALGNFGAAGPTRTDDLTLTKRLLYQLSYSSRVTTGLLASHFDRN